MCCWYTLVHKDLFPPPLFARLINSVNLLLRPHVVDPDLHVEKIIRCIELFVGECKQAINIHSKRNFSSLIRSMFYEQ